VKNRAALNQSKSSVLKIIDFLFVVDDDFIPCCRRTESSNKAFPK